MSKGEFDAAVIGGGPAGCSAAIALAGQGARVIVFEAKSYPHDKLCGEFLSPECAGMLDTLGLMDRIASLNPVSIETVRLTAPGGTAWETRLPGTAWGLTRKALDAVLAERAQDLGVAVREGATVTGIEGNLRDGFRLEIRAGQGGRSRIAARTVIAAHGKRAALDRMLGRSFAGQPQPFVALKAHFDGPPLPGRIELNGFPGGYCGMSEFEGGGANVCLLAHEAAFRAATAGTTDRPVAFVKWMMGQNEALGDWLSQARQVNARWLSIGQVPFTAKRPVEGGVLMAGDAAGLIAPLAGDGIAMALDSGRLAGLCSAEFLAGRLTPEALGRRYAAGWRRRFGTRLRLARLLQAVMLRPPWLAGALRIIQAVPSLGNYLVAHTRQLRAPA